MSQENVDFTMHIEGGETEIEITGDRDAAVIVRSRSGERIYLPPEDYDRPAGGRDSPYQSGRDDSPYQSAPRDDSPYQSSREDSPYQAAPRDDSPYQSARGRVPGHGMVPTANGFLIRHSEPVTEVRLLR